MSHSKKYVNRVITKDPEGNPRIRYYTGRKNRTLFGSVPEVTKDLQLAKIYLDLKEAQKDRPGFTYQSVLIHEGK